MVLFIIEMRQFHRLCLAFLFSITSEFIKIESYLKLFFKYMVPMSLKFFTGIRILKKVKW